MLSPLVAGEPSIVDVLERTTPRYTARLVDDQNVALPAASLLTLRLTLYVITSTGAVTPVNGRDDQDVLNVNNVTINASGDLVWSVQIADTTLVEDLPFERHIALWEWTWTTAAGTRAGKHELVLVIRNLASVP